MRNNFLILFLISSFSYTYAKSLGEGDNKPLNPHNNIETFKAAFLKSFTDYCDLNITLTEVESNSEYLYQAANSIQVSDNYRVLGNSNSEITMKAGFTINLKPGAVVLKGNKYLARIEPCEVDGGCTSLSNADIPRGISPNGDNKNDFFDLSDYCIEELKIFNRYGLEVYQAYNYTNEWYGQTDNGDLPGGTYFYMIRLGNGKKITGWVYINK